MRDALYDLSQSFLTKTKNSLIYKKTSFLLVFLYQLYHFFFHEKFIQGKILKKGFRGNYLNKLVQKWLIHNINSPSNIDFPEFKDKLTEYKQELKYEARVERFYETACQKWKQLENQNMESMKFAMLEIVADTLSMDFDQKSYFGDALFDIIVMLMSKKDQKISKDLFVKKMQEYLGVLWKNDKKSKKACYEYYEFAKNFALVDFPQHETRFKTRIVKYLNFGKMVLNTVYFKAKYCRLVVQDHILHLYKTVSHSYVLLKLNRISGKERIVGFLKEHRLKYKLKKRKLLIKIDKQTFMKIIEKIQEMLQQAKSISQELYLKVTQNYFYGKNQQTIQENQEIQEHNEKQQGLQIKIHTYIQEEFKEDYFKEQQQKNIQQ